MLRYRKSLLSVAFCFYSASSALVCFPGALPGLTDCLQLISSLYHLSDMPGQNEPKEYGRTMDTGIYSEKIPKLIYLHGPEDYDCGILLDVDAVDHDAVDTFRIEDVAAVANAIYGYCLVTRGQLGL